MSVCVSVLGGRGGEIIIDCIFNIICFEHSETVCASDPAGVKYRIDNNVLKPHELLGNGIYFLLPVGPSNETVDSNFSILERYFIIHSLAKLNINLDIFSWWSL